MAQAALTEFTNLEEKKSIKEIQYIVVRLGNEFYGIDISYVDNIVRMQRITRVPKVQPYIHGVINLRGEVVPVMSLRLKMGFDADVETKDTRIIIVKLENVGNVGVMVDEVREVVTLNVDDVEKPAYDAKDEKSGYISGIGKKNDDLISLLDISVALGDEV